MQAPCLVYPLMEGGSLEDRLLLGTVFDEPNGAGAYSTCTAAYALRVHRTATHAHCICTPSGCMLTLHVPTAYAHCIRSALHMGAGYAAARVARLATLGFDGLPPPLTWHARLGALLDVMEALVYLHTPAEVTLTPHPHHDPHPILTQS